MRRLGVLWVIIVVLSVGLVAASAHAQIIEDYLFSDGSLQVARANIRRGRLQVRGWFKPNPNGDGIDLTSEDMQVALFNEEGFLFNDTIPAGEINRRGRTRRYMYNGAAPGITKAKFVRWSDGRWLFTLRARGMDASNFSKPITLQFAVGNDHGEFSLGYGAYCTGPLISCGQLVSASIDILGEQDYYCFDATAGCEYAIEATTGGLDDTELYLYGTDGTTELAYNDDWEDSDGYESRIIWTAPSSGRYRVRVRGYNDSNTGSYWLQITSACCGGCPTSAEIIPCGPVVDGSLDTLGETDYYCFDATVDCDYTIETSLGTLDDTFLHLYDTDGITELEYNDDWDELESRIDWTALSSASYCVRVRAYNDSYTGTYSVWITSSNCCAE